MPLSFHAKDHEFGVATGANVNSGPGASTFDGPPGDSRGLILTATAGSGPDPRGFGAGDGVAVIFTRNGTATMIEDAVLIRRDTTGNGDPALVFEGHDTGGTLTQVFWSPGFDLAGWFRDRCNPQSRPGFHTTDRMAGRSERVIGFTAETRIATAMGGVAAGELWVGDRVATLDAGPQPVIRITERRMSGRRAGAPVLFAPGTIGNHAPLRLAQNHRVLIHPPRPGTIGATFGDLVPARALIDGVAVRLDPCDAVHYVHLSLPGRHLPFAEGAACECLFPDDPTGDIFQPPACASTSSPPARPCAVVP